MIYAVGFVFILIGIIYFKLIRPQKQVYDAFRAQGIPGEPFIPFVGQLPDIIRANKIGKGLDYFIELAQKHGYCYLFGFGPLTRILLAEPELLSDVLSRENGINYRKPPDLTNIVKPFIGTHNLLVSEGKEHDRARKMLNPAFHFVNLRSMVSIMSDETAKAIHSLLLVSSSKGQIDLEIELNSLTLSIIASSAFGIDFEVSSYAKEIMCQTFQEVKEIVEYRTLRMINQIKFLAELPFWGKTIADKGAKQVSDFVDQAITDRRKGKTNSLCAGQDILDLLLSATDDQGEPFTDQQIKEEALTFVLAGHETTGNLMTWAVYMLIIHNDALQACRKEVDFVLSDGIAPTFEHMNELQIIEAVLYETLRLYPPAPFFVRQCVKEHTIGNNSDKFQLHVPVDAMIVIHNYVLHRREDYWPNPLKFDYTRWIRDPVTGLKPKMTHPYAFLPFASGPRNCIGQNFALLEAKVMLAMLVQRCNFELIPGQQIVPEMKGVTMKAKNGILVRVQKRD
ncbi:unnamed protein product [Adineta ricciae]|uniref:Cytochrome P450 n=1 Tax=Adineta ricciae TaxID=249248 RepID=A0A815QEH8_ADIRI|nr:unnamed protein product [Adineta ricciae]CAF1462916.1 unnamed protein product [Adineta ricciae]